MRALKQALRPTQAKSPAPSPSRVAADRLQLAGLSGALVRVSRRDGSRTAYGAAFPPGRHDIEAPLGQPPVFYRPGSAFGELFGSLRDLQGAGV